MDSEKNEGSYCKKCGELFSNRGHKQLFFNRHWVEIYLISSLSLICAEIHTNMLKNAPILTDMWIELVITNFDANQTDFNLMSLRIPPLPEFKFSAISEV